MEGTEELKKSYYDLILDAWNFIKAHMVIEETDGYWQSVKEDAERLYEKHKGTSPDMIKGIITAYYSDLQRRRV
jgi:hypothetical protein